MSNDYKSLESNKSARKYRSTLHKSIQAARMCDNCDLPFCNQCIVEYWSHNFISYAFLGSQKDFTKEYICKMCEKKKRRKSLYISILLLALIGMFIFGFAFLAH